MFLEDMPTAVYRCYDASDRLLYVGMSIDPTMRLAYHRTRSPWWPEMVRSTSEWFPNRLAARQAELRAMREESSVHNKEGLTLPAQGMPARDTRWVRKARRLRTRGASARTISDTIGIPLEMVLEALRADPGWVWPVVRRIA